MRKLTNLWLWTKIWIKIWLKMHYFEKMIVKFARRWRVSPTLPIASSGCELWPHAAALSFNAKDFNNAPYSPTLTSSVVWPSELKRRFHGDSVLWRSKKETKWRHAPRRAGLGSATTHFIQPLKRAFKQKLTKICLKMCVFWITNSKIGAALETPPP